MILTKINPILILILTVLSTEFNLLAQDSTTFKEQITPASVLDNYFESIGGKDLYSKMMDRTIYFTGTSLGQEISVTIMQKFPDKLFQEVIAGEVNQKKYYDGNNGILILGDNKIEIEGTELELLRIDSAIDFLLNPQKYDVKFEFAGQEMFDSLICNKIKITLPSGNIWFQNFDSETGLRIKEIKEIQTPTGNYEQVTYYSDYKNVNGLKFPFEIRQTLGAQITTLRVDSIKINSGLPDSLFLIPEK